MQLEFTVRGQQIFRVDKTPLASDSRLYIAGKVAFDAEWDDITAVYLNFEPRSGEAINAYLTDGAFDESLGVSLSAGSWRVSAHGSNSAGKEIHTTSVLLNVAQAGCRNGKAPTGGGSSGGSSVAIDDTLTVSGAAADAKTVGALFDAIRGEMDNLHPLEIKSFTVYPDIVEKGSTVTAQVFSYSVNRTSAETKIDGTAVTGGSASRSDALSEDKTYTLTATLKGVTKTKTASVRFVAPIYYGVSESYTLENETVLSLNRLLKTSKSLSFTVNAASGQYILFAIPVSMGTPTFNVGGFEGGFTLSGTFELTNSSGHSEDYRLYRSVNSGLGSTKVSVS